MFINVTWSANIMLLMNIGFQTSFLRDWLLFFSVEVPHMPRPCFLFLASMRIFHILNLKIHMYIHTHVQFALSWFKHVFIIYYQKKLFFLNGDYLSTQAGLKLIDSSSLSLFSLSSIWNYKHTSVSDLPKCLIKREWKTNYS